MTEPRPHVDFCMQEGRISKIESTVENILSRIEKRLDQQSDKLDSLERSVTGQRHYLLEMGIPDLRPNMREHHERIEVLESHCERMMNSSIWRTGGLSALWTAFVGFAAYSVHEFIQIWHHISELHSK